MTNPEKTERLRIQRACERLRIWPITRHFQDRHWAFCAFIRTGVVVFCVADWDRGDVDTVSRAKGTMAGRGLRTIHVLGSCQQFGNECYPNLESAILRWPQLKRLEAMQRTCEALQGGDCRC